MAVMAILLSQLVLANLDPIIIDDPIPTEDPIPIPEPEQPDDPIPSTEDPNLIDFETRSYSGHKRSFDYQISVTKLSQNGKHAVFAYSIGICELSSPGGPCPSFASLSSEGKVKVSRKHAGEVWVIKDELVKTKLYPNFGKLKIDGYPRVFVKPPVK